MSQDNRPTQSVSEVLFLAVMLVVIIAAVYLVGGVVENLLTGSMGDVP